MAAIKIQSLRDVARVYLQTLGYQMKRKPTAQYDL